MNPIDRGFRWILIFGALAVASSIGRGAIPLQQSDRIKVPREAPDDPMAPGGRFVNPAASVSTGPYVSIQVNVDKNGSNILGDAANEPSIGVDPTNPGNLVIGWRQFDTVASNFRQAGWAYSLDRGTTWTFPGVIDPGQFRTDPVIGADADGDFFYFSLNGNFLCDLFKSADKGKTWGPPVPAWGGDKNWMAIDRTSSSGRGHIYGIWQRYYNCCDEDTFTRSTDGGSSFDVPIEIPGHPTFGVLDVGPTGDVWAAGLLDQEFDTFLVSRSTSARDAGQIPSFTTFLVDLGGWMEYALDPNPGGLAGQAYVRVDPRDPDRVYALCSVNPPGQDLLDVHFIRSTDAGVTWSSPSRVNDVSTGYQWFGTMSVAPDGRIDVIWNDTRNGQGEADLSELFYAYSYDEGRTFDGNVPVSPQWNSHLGWPNQSKIGDYYDMASDDHGADLAYAATFNGEQDVYYVRLFPDCNGNGEADLVDIETGVSNDVDADHVPDECEFLAMEAEPLDPAIGSSLMLTFDNGFPGSFGLLYLVEVDSAPANVGLGLVFYDGSGKSEATVGVPRDPALRGHRFTLLTFAIFLDGKVDSSNTVTVTIQ